jgi:Na+-translocating ferredoxin:NAD+ oxidoreductase RnfG subunit
MKKTLFLIMAVLTVVFLATPAFSSTDDIVKQLLPDSDLKARSLILADADIEQVNKIVGELVAVKGVYIIYPSKTGAVILDEEQGKHGMIEMAILIDAATKKIKDIIIISMKERRGRGIVKPIFLKQYIGKSLLDPIALGSDIKAISGATVSSRAVTITVKRALVLYDIFLSKHLK